MAKKQRDFLLSSARAKSSYFWARNMSSGLVGLIVYIKLEPFSKILGVLLALPVMFIFYRFISHWVAMFLVFVETLLGGRRM